MNTRDCEHCKDWWDCPMFGYIDSCPLAKAERDEAERVLRICPNKQCNHYLIGADKHCPNQACKFFGEARI
jgi:hypothetical protein